jgi:hypothetical protein
MTELLDTTTLSTRQPEGETVNSGAAPRQAADIPPPARRLVGLPKLAALAREQFGPVATYHRIWLLCTSGALPAWRCGALWILDQDEALAALPRLLFKRPTAAPDTAA